MAIIISNGRARGGCGCLGCAGVLGLGLLLMSLFGMLAGGMTSGPRQAPASPPVPASRSVASPTPLPASPTTPTDPASGASGAPRSATVSPATSSGSRTATATATPSGASASFELFPEDPATPAPNGGSWVLSTPSR